MMNRINITVVTGSRADRGLLEWPIKILSEDEFFCISVLDLWNLSFDKAYLKVAKSFKERPDIIMVLGDRFEILAAATAAHLLRIPIAHIAGGDVTRGSYDDAMRDCISRMAYIHFATSEESRARLEKAGYKNVHMVGSPGIDYILNAKWKKKRPIDRPYVVVSYQAETIDGTNSIKELLESLPDKHKFFCIPNLDMGNDAIRNEIAAYIEARGDAEFFMGDGHDEFLNLLSHCDQFIGNSSALLYEAPILGIGTRMVGKRQLGRVVPSGDGKASIRMASILLNYRDGFMLRAA